ncbi:hypothetical protein MPRF_51390 [Mycolicibacterium parafortuitum]|uniref:Uncharacterized protein n=1 Tax=Mycolicibacterium parafortuitum TaxID=39692 RepID=A0A7I7UAU2_MYCPF|nr:hypothetical protein MPRF_51390 [Mycolicibacterium parafortuitum]
MSVAAGNPAPALVRQNDWPLPNPALTANGISGAATSTACRPAEGEAGLLIPDRTATGSPSASNCIAPIPKVHGA